MATSQITTVSLSHDTKDRLAAQGSKGDSFDDIINDLLDQVEAGDSE